MTQYNSDTMSPVPFSPFSSNSVASEITSDEPGDLGAFNTIFRELNYLRRPIISTRDVHDTPTSSLLVIASDYESDHLPGTARPWTTTYEVSAPAYLSESSPDTASDPSNDIHSAESLASDTEAVVDALAVAAEDKLFVDGINQPSLGYLDEALSFIAAERARFTAQREARFSQKEASSAPSLHVVDSSKKRRKRKSKPSVRVLPDGESHSEVTVSAVERDDDADDSSSSPDATFSSFHYKSTHNTPSIGKKGPPKLLTRGRLPRSQSTPTLRSTVALPLDPHAVQMHALARKLRRIFPDDTHTLSSVLTDNTSGSLEFFDPRGPSPNSTDAPVHVFIDHSNILVGFLNHIKRQHRHSARKGLHMSHAALTFILERGRPVSRRVLVASSPLYQPMDSAEQLGYEVRVYARVPDTGDGQDKIRQHQYAEVRGRGPRMSAPVPIKGQAPKRSKDVNMTSESEPGTSPYGSSPKKHSRTSGVFVAGNSPGQNVSPGRANGRVRYREQGVDELLQLKLHQAIADIDVPPPNATIVLATGDGNVGQFNEEGFLGCVRTALKKGWRVELYAWEDGLSRAWKREFGDGPYSDRFRIVGLEKFGEDLIEI